MQRPERLSSRKGLGGHGKRKPIGRIYQTYSEKQGCGRFRANIWIESLGIRGTFNLGSSGINAPDYAAKLHEWGKQKTTVEELKARLKTQMLPCDQRPRRRKPIGNIRWRVRKGIRTTNAEASVYFEGKDHTFSLGTSCPEEAQNRLKLLRQKILVEGVAPSAARLWLRSLNTDPWVIEEKTVNRFCSSAENGGLTLGEFLKTVVISPSYRTAESALFGLLVDAICGFQGQPLRLTRADREDPTLRAGIRALPITVLSAAMLDAAYVARVISPKKDERQRQEKKFFAQVRSARLLLLPRVFRSCEAKGIAVPDVSGFSGYAPAESEDTTPIWRPKPEVIVQLHGDLRAEWRQPKDRNAILTVGLSIFAGLTPDERAHMKWSWLVANVDGQPAIRFPRSAQDGFKRRQYRGEYVFITPAFFAALSIHHGAGYVLQGGDNERRICASFRAGDWLRRHGLVGLGRGSLAGQRLYAMYRAGKDCAHCYKLALSLGNFAHETADRLIDSKLGAELRQLWEKPFI